MQKKDSETDFEFGLRLIKDKCERKSDLEWEDIIDILKLDCHRDSLRKACNVTEFSSYNVMKYYEEKMLRGDNNSSDIEDLIDELKMERIKLRTLNIERNKANRIEAKRELYYENIGYLISKLEPPKFNEISINNLENVYIMNFSDIHYNASFKSVNNTYNRAECKRRFELLLAESKEFIEQNNVSEIIVINGGDSLQGMLRVSDVKLNDLSVVDSLVEFQKLMAEFLNQLSKYCMVRYYHVNSANHTEIRLLNSKAGDMAVEDMEKIIINYLSDVLEDNQRVYINKDFVSDSIQFEELGYNFIVLHGHQLRDIKNSIRDLSEKYDKSFDFCILGHYHQGMEMVVGERKNYAKEVLVCPSFVGACPYADKLMVGGKAMVKIHCFTKGKGRKSTYNIVLN